MPNINNFVELKIDASEFKKENFTLDQRLKAYRIAVEICGRPSFFTLTPDKQDQFNEKVDEYFLQLKSLSRGILLEASRL
jgi:hypothetical protein